MAKKSTPRSEAADVTNAETQPRTRARSRTTREMGPDSTGTDNSATLSDAFSARGDDDEQRPRYEERATSSSSMGSEPSEEDIRMRAYHRYLERGAGDGMAFEDWLEAERELRDRK